MRNENALFWREAARSLPETVRARYLGYFEAAETWELLLDAALQLGSRVKHLLARRPRTQAA